ncbi:MAG TPA: hypothetical protein VFM18_18585 [Methanosarcina sp.]|nr:hypothetical protein [Methanosarcina sp.]
MKTNDFVNQAIANHLEKVSARLNESMEPTNPQDLMQVFRDNEDNNAHTENLLLMAQAVGDDNDIRNASNLVSQKERQGYMDDTTVHIERKLRNKLWPLFQAKYGKQELPEFTSENAEEAFRKSLNEGQVDTILEYLNTAYQTLKQHIDSYPEEYAENFETFYSLLRGYLMKDDMDRFLWYWEYLLGKYPDAFGIFAEALFEAAGIGAHGSFDEFLKLTSDSEELHETLTPEVNLIISKAVQHLAPLLNKTGGVRSYATQLATLISSKYKIPLQDTMAAVVKELEPMGHSLDEGWKDTAKKVAAGAVIAGALANPAHAKGGGGGHGGGGHASVAHSSEAPSAARGIKSSGYPSWFSALWPHPAAAPANSNNDDKKKKEIKENATGGATGAGSVAVVSNTLGEKGAFSKKDVDKKLGGYSNMLTRGGPVKLHKVKK